MIGQSISHYRILEKLGGGGMGVVYRAEDERLGRTVALKFLNPALIASDANRKRFLREAQAASAIDHPNVCPVYQVEETDDGRLFLSMAFCGGRSLKDRLEAGPLEPREAFETAFAVAQGLWAAHRRGIVHRDVKPGNVMITEDGFVKIVDFGLALLSGYSRVTTGDARVGTVAYMSPEQASGSTVDERTDIWSLGVVLYECLTGRIPFRGEVDAALLYAIRNEPHLSVDAVNPALPAACAAVVERCLRKDPAERYQTVEDLLAAMVSAARELGWTDSMGSRAIAPILAARKRRVFLRGLVAAGVAAALVGGGYLLWPRRVPTVYSTDMRVAVMPTENLLGPPYQTLADGIAIHSIRVASWLAGKRESMWVAGASKKSVALPTEAGEALGVNRVVTSDLQRFGGGFRLAYALRDAGSQSVLGEEEITFDGTSLARPLNEIPDRLARLLGVEAQAMEDASWWRTDVDGAARGYLTGVGLWQAGREQVAAATDTLRAACDLDPGFAALIRAYGSAALALYLRTDDPGWLVEAKRAALSITASAPSMSDAAILLAGVYAETGAVDSAITHYRVALELDPGSMEATRRLGSIYVSESRIAEAEQVYRDAVVALRDCWAAYVSLGKFYYDQGRFDEAATAWRRSIALAPHDALTITNLGAVHHARGEWEEARKLFLQAYRIKPGCVECNNVATALYFEHKFGESAKYFEFAVEKCDTSDYVVWGNWASALYWVDGERDHAGRIYARAIEKAQSALAVRPDDASAISQLISYYVMSGRGADARAMIERAAPFLQSDSEVMYSVGSAYEVLGEREAALHHMADAVRYGYPAKEILSAPALADLVEDSRFQELIRDETAATAPPSEPGAR